MLNTAPTFSSPDTFSVVENTTAAGTVTATDADADDSVTGYAVTGGADQALFSIDSGAGALTFKSAPNFEAPADANTDNAYAVEVTATSGTGTRQLTVTQAITVTVTDDDTEEVLNTAPTFSSPDTFSVVENTTAAGTVTATDADADDSVTGYAVTGGADQALSASTQTQAP